MRRNNQLENTPVFTAAGLPEISYLGPLNYLENIINLQEDWQPDGDGWSGHYVIKFEGVPGSVAAEFELYPTDDGCVYSITHTPKVNMPIVGKTLQKILASQIEDGCDAEIDYLVETLG